MSWINPSLGQTDLGRLVATGGGGGYPPPDPLIVVGFPFKVGSFDPTLLELTRLYYINQRFAPKGLMIVQLTNGSGHTFDVPRMT